MKKNFRRKMNSKRHHTVLITKKIYGTFYMKMGLVDLFYNIKFKSIHLHLPKY